MKPPTYDRYGRLFAGVALVILFTCSAAQAQSIRWDAIGTLNFGNRWTLPAGSHVIIGQCDIQKLLVASQEWALLSMRRSYLDGAGGPFMSYTERLRVEADLIDNKNRAEWAWRNAVETCSK